MSDPFTMPSRQSFPRKAAMSSVEMSSIEMSSIEMSSIQMSQSETIVPRRPKFIDFSLLVTVVGLVVWTLLL
jgi:hypothetical protein